MSRCLGRVEDGVNPPLFFIHCNSADTSLRPLFPDRKTAWQVYDEREASWDFEEAVPIRSREVRVVRKFTEDFLGSSEPQFALATTERLLLPREPSCYASYALLRIDGQLHVGRLIEGGMDGNYEAPLCDQNRPFTPTDQRYVFADYFGKPVTLCQRCLDRLLNDNKTI